MASWSLGKQIAALALAAAISAHAADGPAFEVASIKPVESPDVRMIQARNQMWNMMPVGSVPLRGRRVDLRATSLEHLIALAYRVRHRQVSGPSWIKDKFFDIEALLPEDASPGQASDMLQRLLKERFGLEAHVGSREQSGYVLAVGKDGHKLSPASPMPAGEMKMPDGNSLAERMRKPGLSGSSRHEMKRTTMDRVSDTLAHLLEAPVENRTGIEGRWDVLIEVPPPVDPQDKDVRPRVIDAVKKLGLTLRPGKVTEPAVIVDAVAKVPTGN